MSIWNVDSLMEFIKEQEKRYEQRFAAQEQAVKIAEASAEKWRNQANEWRSAMMDRERTFFSKGMGYVTGALSSISLLLVIMDKIK